MAPIGWRVLHDAWGQARDLGEDRGAGWRGRALKRVLRRATSEREARKIFSRAEWPLDTESEAPAGAGVRASRTIKHSPMPS